MVAMINEALGKRRNYGEPSTIALTMKLVCFVKKDGYRLMAITDMRATFNKLSRYAFCVYTSRSEKFTFKILHFI